MEFVDGVANGREKTKWRGRDFVKKWDFVVLTLINYINRYNDVINMIVFIAPMQYMITFFFDSISNSK